MLKINIIERIRDKFIFRKLFPQNFKYGNCHFKFKMTIKKRAIGSSAAGQQEVPIHQFLL